MLTIRQFSLWCTFIHACFQLVVVPIAVGLQCWQLVEEQSSKADATLSDRVWALREQLIHTTPTALHMIISAFAASYYAMDFVTMVRAKAAAAAAAWHGMACERSQLWCWFSCLVAFLVSFLLLFSLCCVLFDCSGPACIP